LVSGFGRQKRCAYEAFVNDTETDAVYEFYSKPKIAPILGGEPFIAKCIEGKNTDLNFPELASVKPSPNPAEIIASILKVCGVTKKELMTSRRGLASKSPARSFAMLLLHEKGELILKEVSDYFGLSGYASAGSVIRKLRKNLEKSSELREVYNLIMLYLTP